jgi:hypothetical protein
MEPHRVFRLSLPAALLLALGVALNAGAEVAPSPSPTTTAEPQRPAHLREWMAAHASLTLPEMLQALEEEPAFQKIPAQNQQRLRDQLVRIYKMNRYPHGTIKPV